MSSWALIVFALVGKCAGNQPGGSAPAAATNTVEDHTQPVEVDGSLVEQYVKPYLKDPDSARFSDVTYRTRQGLPVFCGFVNSKNSFGGYSGDEQFVAVGPLVSMSEQTSASRWRRLWQSYCIDTDETDAARKHPAGKRHHAG